MNKISNCRRALMQIGQNGGYRLLASGTYTEAVDGVQLMEIPVSYSGTPKIVFVTAANGNSLTGTWAWCLILGTEDLTENVFSSVRMAKCDSNSDQIAPANLSEDKITLGRASSARPIHAQDYNWYIYGET